VEVSGEEWEEELRESFSDSGLFPGLQRKNTFQSTVAVYQRGIFLVYHGKLSQLSYVY